MACLDDKNCVNHLNKHSKAVIDAFDASMIKDGPVPDQYHATLVALATPQGHKLVDSVGSTLAEVFCKGF